MSRAIVTVGIHPTRGFGPYLERFKRTFGQHGCADEIFVWDKDWPPGSPPHEKCHYAFKVFAVRAALNRGHERVLWFDSSCHAIASLEPLWGRLERDGYVLVPDANPLGAWSSDASLAEFAVTRDEAMGFPLSCGTCWGVDLRSDCSRAFCTLLQDYARPEHFCGTHVSRNRALGEHPRPGTQGAQVSNDGRVWGHRSDEVFMSLIARKLGMKFTPVTECEFVGGNPRHAGASVLSGYDL